MLLIAGAAGVVAVGARGYYALVPVNAPLLTESSLCRATGNGARLALSNGRPCVGLSVPPARGHAVNGSIYMVNILVGPANPFQ